MKIMEIIDILLLAYIYNILYIYNYFFFPSDNLLKELHHTHEMYILVFQHDSLSRDRKSRDTILTEIRFCLN